MGPRNNMDSNIESIMEEIRINELQGLMSIELADSQTWKGDQGTVYEKKEAIQKRMIRSAVERNQKFFSKIENRLPRAEARMLQNAKREDILMKDAENSEHKHWISNASKRKAARAQNPLADESSYDMHEAIVESERRKDDLIGSRLRNHPELNDGRVDWRALYLFTENYRLNAQGKPATRRDEDIKRSDNECIDAFLTGDLKDREPYLRNAMEWVMSLDLRPEMFSDYYLRKNTVKMKEIADRLLYIENLNNDPINKPFFDSLRKDEKDILEIRREQCGAIGAIFNNKLALKGVNSNNGKYYNSDSATPEFIQENQDKIITYSKANKANLIDGKDAESYLFNLEADEMAKDYAYKRKQEYDDNINRQFASWREARAHTDEDAGESFWQEQIRFDTPITEEAREIMQGFRRIYINNPDNYVANRDLLQKLYQDMYRRCELYGNTSIQRQGYENVARETGDEGYARRRLSDAATARAKGLRKLEDEYKRELDAYQNAVSFYLKGDKLTAEGRRVLSEAGVDKDMISAEQKRQKSAAKGK